jgi:hypothetical protein
MTHTVECWCCGLLATQSLYWRLIQHDCATSAGTANLVSLSHVTCFEEHLLKAREECEIGDLCEVLTLHRRSLSVDLAS